MEIKNSQKREQPESAKAITEETKSSELEEKKPKTLLWGSKTLSSGLLLSNEKQNTATSNTGEKANLLKWGTGKNSLSNQAVVSPISVPVTPTEKEKSEDKKEDVVFQMRVVVYILEDKEYKNRGRGLLKVLKLNISFKYIHVYFP